MVGVDVVDPFMQPTYSAEGAQAADSKQPEPDWPLAGADCSTLLRLLQQRRATAILPLHDRVYAAVDY